MIPLRCGHDTAIQRIESLLVDTTTSFPEFNVTADVSRVPILIEFDHGSDVNSEHFATLLAQTLGWEKSHGVIVGRAESGNSNRSKAIEEVSQ